MQASPCGPAKIGNLQVSLVNSRFLLSKSSDYGYQETQKNASEPTVLTNCEVQSMRMKMVCDDRTLREVANEFIALKKAQKVHEIIILFSLPVLLVQVKGS